MMTVAELIEKLHECDQDAGVLVSADPDSGEYLELDFVETELAVDEDGNVGVDMLTEELAKMGMTEDDVVEGQKVISLSA